MKKNLFIGITIVMTTLLYGCVKDLHNTGISESTLLKGRVIEESETEALVNVKVTVTDGTNEYAITKTNNDGRFELTVNYNNFDVDNYLFLDAGSSGLTKRVELKGMGHESYNYGDIPLYNKNDGARPTLSTKAVEGISSNGAVCGGDITSDGGKDVTKRGLCWGLSKDPNIYTNDTIECGSGMGEFWDTITGLSQNTIYHVRAFAINAIGLAYGQDIPFTTSNGGGHATKPIVSTHSITTLSSNSAECRGDVTSDGGSTVTERGLCWAKATTTDVPTMVNFHKKEGGGGTGTFFCTMENLIANTEYYVCAYAINEVDISYGVPIPFTTLTGDGDSAPTVITDRVEGILSNSAKCFGSVVADGGSHVYERGICWSTSPHPRIPTAPWGTIPEPNGTEYVFDTEDGTGTFSCDMNSLSPNTTYYVCAFASNSVKREYGEDITFKTLDNNIDPPEVRTWSFDPSTYKCQSMITYIGGAPVTTCGICWGISENVTIYNTTNIMPGNVPGTIPGYFTCTIPTSGLSTNTTYYVKAFATNKYGTDHGEPIPFVYLGGGSGGGSTTATIILTAGDVWGDGTGYQMLLDKTHSLYGSTIPTDGAISTSCSGNESIYAQFDYKIPTNADGNCSTQHIVHNNSVSITIPAGVYDWCITNPTPDDRIWIASSQGNVGGRQNDYEFEAGNTYEFTVTLSGQNDAVNVVITGGGKGKKSMGQSNVNCRQK